MARRALLTTYRHLFLLLVGLGLLARVLVPVGWMPHVSDGGVRLVLCGGFGPVAAQAPSHHAQHATPAHDGHDAPAPPHDQSAAEMGAPCPFTLASASALLVNDVASIAPLQPAAQAARWTAFAITRASRLAAPPPPAIGPPTA